MAIKPENQFISSVHHHLPITLHREKKSDQYHGGPADVWYSGNKADLWVEYKFMPSTPKRERMILPALSDLQIEWLAGRYTEGRNVAVILGCPDGGVIYRDLDWERPISVARFHELLYKRRGLADWIAHQTMKGRTCPTSPRCSPPKRT